MRLEWKMIGIAVVFATVVCLKSPAAASAFFGWMSLVCGYITMIYVIVYGYMTARFLEMKPYGHSTDYEDHRSSIALMTAWVLMGVVGIEIGVRKAGGQWGDLWFVAFHLVLVLGMAVMYVLARFMYTGVSAPEHHSKLAYWYAVFYTGALITGSILVNQKFPLWPL